MDTPSDLIIKVVIERKVNRNSFKQNKSPINPRTVFRYTTINPNTNQIIELTIDTNSCSAN